MARFLLKGSERTLSVPPAQCSPAEPSETLEVSVLVRRRADHALRTRVAQLTAGDRGQRHLTRAEFAQFHGADPADFEAVRRFAESQGLAVVWEHSARRTIRLAGSVAQFNAAFAVELMTVPDPRGAHRGRTGVISLPAELEGIVVAVLGLDDRRQAKPHFRIRPPVSAAPHRAGTPAALSYRPERVASLYGFPNGEGAGQAVALIELGGGFDEADLAAYFSASGSTAPEVIAVGVDQAGNRPTGQGSGPDGEVMLDIEIVGAIAPQATIVVYFAPNTDAGFLDAVTTAIHDTTYRPAVISISWGGPESSWTAQAKTALDDAFQAAASLGITVCVASGDNGSSDGAAPGTDNVDFPASSAFALACGGTTLRASSGAIASETVWNEGATGGASGGGISTFFAAPSWQAHLAATKTAGESIPLSMRGVPDVAGDADPQTGYLVRVDGADAVIGGTSAVAPLWAALITRLNAATGKPLGFVNPLLYANPSALRDIREGNNGDFAATAGWDACTGLGSPDGSALAALIASADAANGAGQRDR